MKTLIALIMTLSTIVSAYAGAIIPKPKTWTAYNLGIDDLNMGIQDFKAYDDNFWVLFTCYEAPFYDIWRQMFYKISKEGEIEITDLDLGGMYALNIAVSGEDVYLLCIDNLLASEEKEFRTLILRDGELRTCESVFKGKSPNDMIVGGDGNIYAAIDDKVFVYNEKETLVEIPIGEDAKLFRYGDGVAVGYSERDYSKFTEYGVFERLFLARIDTAAGKLSDVTELIPGRYSYSADGKLYFSREDEFLSCDSMSGEPEKLFDISGLGEELDRPYHVITVLDDENILIYNADPIGLGTDSYMLVQKK